MDVIPDLLSDEPMVRVDLADLRQSLVFAFATGGLGGEVFDKALEGASLPQTTWDKSCFERDLFLSDLIGNCLRIRIGGRVYKPCTPYLHRVLAAPPRSFDAVVFRQRLLKDLSDNSDLRKDFERIYIKIVQIRTRLCASHVGRRTGSIQRRMDILRAIHDVFTDMSTAFETASSGVGRIREFGQAICDSDQYRHLGALLDHNEHLGTVDVQLRVGSDGELRTFKIVALRENTSNRFYSSPFWRWLQKIRFLWRGYRMNGGEVVEHFFDDVFTGIEASVALLFQLMGDMEFYLAGLGFHDLANDKGLQVSFPEFCSSPEDGQPNGSGLDLLRLFNPLLLVNKAAPVPCDLVTSHDNSVVIVTGPNSGGKTRLLQAIALLQLMGQSGLFVPAKKARLPWISGLFVSLIEEARADQPEGQLGMELLRIRRMFEELDLGSLVLLDELCSGTNPSEGEEIAHLVISLLPELKSQVFITTHLLQFAEKLASTRPISSLEFLQVELDGHECPQFTFVPGVARTSLAHKTAARLGVTRDELLGLIAAKKRSLPS